MYTLLTYFDLKPILAGICLSFFTIKKKSVFDDRAIEKKDSFPVAYKLEGGGVKALMARPLEKKITFFAATLIRSAESSCIHLQSI